MIKEAIVTPEEVVEAYYKTGLKPINCEHYVIRNGQEAGCAMGALYVDIYGPPEDSVEGGNLMVARLDELLGDGYRFGLGFDQGFAGKEQEVDRFAREGRPELQPFYDLGYDCGVRVKEEFID